MIKKIIIILILIYGSSFAQNYKIVESNEKFIIIETNFNNSFYFNDTLINGKKYTKVIGNTQFNKNEGEPLLPESYYSFGIPYNSSPTITILNTESDIIYNKFILPVPKYNLDGNMMDVANFNKEIYSSNFYYPNNTVEIKAKYISRYSKILNVLVSPYQFNPVKNELKFNKKVTFKLSYNEKSSEGFTQLNDYSNNEFIKTSVINYEQAVNWAGKFIESKNSPVTADYWYKPNKEYFKIYLNEKGVYRIKYEDLVDAGLNSSLEIPINKLELFCNGVKIPIDVFSKGDTTFGERDYFQFCGYPPTPTEYSNLNIYNTTNIYWFSYQADSTGYQYKNKSGYPLVWGKTYTTNKKVIHYEKDKLYERFGLTSNVNRDYWMWGKAYAKDGVVYSAFFESFEYPEFLCTDSTNVKIRVGLAGINAGLHQADIQLTSQQVGTKTWSNQEQVVFEKEVKLGDVLFFPNNNFQVYARGTDDEIRVNWFEIEYWQNNSPFSDNFYFSTADEISGKTKFVVYHWTADTMLVYNPTRGEIIRDAVVTHNAWDNVEFVDAVYSKTDYFCVSTDYFLSPDSIKKNINSDLRNVAQGADYIIIAYPNFLGAAERLAEYRRSNLTGYDNPRVKVVNVFDIYNEFSSGLLKPSAIQDFAKYAFLYWQNPAPAFIALFGDMSYDYRGIFPNSRKNYIPSMPIRVTVDSYGQSVSDNDFVAINGNDVIPEMAIGRLSCETIEEAKIIVDKILSYPSDNSKEWKQRVMLFAAGETKTDEDQFKFNNESLLLQNNYIFPEGFSTSKVFMYNNGPTHAPFIGTTPDLMEDFKDGGVVANFFGHGGGYQWDAIMLSDHIYLLENEGRMPFITSVTCYTAHFENQDVFGEQFVKTPNKGAIAFWGNPSLTSFQEGKNLNRKLYNQIFANKKHVIGEAIRAAKNSYVTGYSSVEGQHIELFTLLGDPAIELCFAKKPDFRITNNDISLSVDAPLVETELEIKLHVQNLGIIFPNDSVAIKITITSSDSVHEFSPKYLQSFGEQDSIAFKWVPSSAGLFTIKAEVNADNAISEDDMSDNSAQKTISVYNVKSVSIISPLNGSSFVNDSINFIFADPSDYVGKIYSFFIEIDTSYSFSEPLIQSPELFGNDGLVRWRIPSKLAKGVYYWRTRIKDLEQSPIWSGINTFSVNDTLIKSKYSLKENQLSLFNSENIYYNHSKKALMLNLEKLPPHPDDKRMIEDIFPETVNSLQSLTAITTDGTYLIVGHIAYYGQGTLLHKFGTGFNGTEKGKYYGVIPCDTLKIWNTIFYHDKYIYVATGDPYNLLRIDPITGEKTKTFVPDGLLDVFYCTPLPNGAFYVKTDGKYVYNLTTVDSLGSRKYQLRIFDPANNFNRIHEDIVFTGSSYESFTDFFVANGYVYPCENLYSGYMRKLNINTQQFEGNNWGTSYIYQGFYGWTYDYINDVVYGSVYRSNKIPKFRKFYGSYYQTYGTTYSPEISNAKKWISSNYSLSATGSSGSYQVELEGKNKYNNTWEILYDSVSFYTDLSELDSEKFPELRYKFTLADSSIQIFNPIQIKGIGFDYIGYPEVKVSSSSFMFNPDSLMQGFPIDMTFNVKNYGYSQIDSLKLNFKLNDNSTSFITKNIELKPDSVFSFKYTLNTSPLLFSNKVTVEALTQEKELFDFNNIASKSFYVSRDSTNPAFDIKFDGEEIINGDIISAKPLVTMSLTDNSPLPLDSTFFYIYHNNIQVPQDSLHFSYTPYPNSTAIVSWNPTLKDGTHYLEVLARDASLNYFDTTSYKIWFTVNNTNQIREVFNYPNPFTNSTYFTFNMLGTKKPEEIKIKIFTIAGRLIKNLEIPTEHLKFGFNKFYWDGKDEDGDEIGNGVYFYKIIIKEDGEVRSETKKIAKIR